MSKRAREEEEDGEITNTQILDELSVLKEEVDFLREDNKLLSRQYADAADQRDKYKSRLNRRKEGARKWKEDLEDESVDSLRADYAELRYEMETKRDKWKSERNKWVDRVERLEVKVEALKEENHKLVVMETRLRSDFERRILSSTSEQRYKEQIKQLEESLRHSEVSFRAADALQREQEAATDTMRANVRHMEDLMRNKDDKIAALQMAASRAAQQLADASNALDHAAHQKAALDKSLAAANTKFHEQIKVDAQKITSLTNDLAEKTRMLSEQKNSAIHLAAKLQMFENAEKSMMEEIARLTDINSKLIFADEQVRLLQADNHSLTAQLAFRNGGPPDVLIATIETLKLQIFSLTAELARMRAFSQEYELERAQLLEEISVLRHGKGLGPFRNGMVRGAFANMQLRLAQLGSAIGMVLPPGHAPPQSGHGPARHAHLKKEDPGTPNQNVPSPTNTTAQTNPNSNGPHGLSPSEPTSPTPAGPTSPTTDQTSTTTSQTTTTQTTTTQITNNQTTTGQTTPGQTTNSDASHTEQSVPSPTEQTTSQSVPSPTKQTTSPINDVITHDRHEYPTTNVDDAAQEARNTEEVAG